MNSPLPRRAADRIPKRELEKLVAWTLGERLRSWWYRLRMTVGEMNYASWCLLGPMVPVPAEKSRLDQARGQG
jgi:hypothetical protein